MREPQRTTDIRSVLLRRLHSGYAELIDELRGAEEQAEAATENGWSLRDHLSHLAAWVSVEVARTEGRSGAAEALSLALEPVRRRWSTDSVAHTLRHLDAAHRRLVVALVEAEEAALRRAWHAAYPDSLAANVARNTYQHYSEHLPAIRRLLSTSQVEKIPSPSGPRGVGVRRAGEGALRPGGPGGGQRPRRPSAS
jgi:hypothetical protein